MNKLLICLLVFLVPSIGISKPKPRAKIASSTYSIFTVNVFDACMEDETPSKEMKTLCFCISQVATSNFKTIVKRHHLQYLDQIPDHTDELLITETQSKDCLDQATAPDPQLH